MCWKKTIFFYQLRLLSEKFQLFVEKVSAGSPKLNSTCLLELCEEKIVSVEVFRSSLLISNSEPFVFAFHQTSLHGVVTTALQVARRFFWRNIVFLKNFLYLSFWTLIGNFVALWRKSLRSVIKTEFFMSFGFLWRNFLRKEYKVLINFEHSLQNFRLFVKNSLAVLSNCILLVRRTFWVQRFLIESNGFCWLTSGKERKKIGFWSNFSYRVVETAFSFSKRSFWGKLSFWRDQVLLSIWDKELKVFGRVGKNSL